MKYEFWQTFGAAESDEFENYVFESLVQDAKKLRSTGKMRPHHRFVYMSSQPSAYFVRYELKFLEL